MKNSIVLILLVFLCLPGFAFAENFSRTLDLGDASGATGDTVWLPLAISGTGGSVGGTAFTLELDSTMFEVVGIRENQTSTPEVVDPEIYCDTLPCENPYTTTNGPVGTGALFFQYNDDGSGKALVAAAAAEALPDDATLMEVGIKIKGSVSTETVFDINLLQTSLAKNTDAGYDADSNPIPLLSGLPSLTPDTNGNYPVQDNFTSSLQGGMITVSGGCPGKRGDVDGNNVVDILDARYILYSFYGIDGYPPTSQIENCIGDVDGNNVVDVLDARYILYSFYGVEGYSL